MSQNISLASATNTGKNTQSFFERSSLALQKIIKKASGASQQILASVGLASALVATDAAADYKTPKNTEDRFYVLNANAPEPRREIILTPHTSAIRRETAIYQEIEATEAPSKKSQAKSVSLVGSKASEPKHAPIPVQSTPQIVTLTPPKPAPVRTEQKIIAVAPQTPKKSEAPINKIDRIVPVDNSDIKVPFVDGQVLALRNSHANVRDITGDTFSPIATIQKRDNDTITFDANRPVKRNEAMDITFYPVTITSKDQSVTSGYISSILVGEFVAPKARTVAVKSYRSTQYVRNEKLSDEENEWREKLSKMEPYIDYGTKYQFRTPQEELKQIITKVGLDEKQLDALIPLISHIAQHESNWNYGAKGERITHNSVHKGTQALGFIQVMPYNWYRWSKEQNDGVVVDVTDVNQEKIGLGAIGAYYKKYQDRGLSFDSMLNELAMDWYGRTVVNGLPSPSSYANRFIRSVKADTEHVNQIKTLYASARSSSTPVVAKAESKKLQTSAVTPAFDASMLQKVSMNTASLIDMPAVNDSAYYKSAPAIQKGMSKVVELKKYLENKPHRTSKEESYTRTFANLDTEIKTADRSIETAAKTGDTRNLIAFQIRK